MESLEGGGTRQTLAIIPNSLNAEIGSKLMRSTINKLKKGNSTKGERRFMELCKKLRIPFKTKVLIADREVDFLIGKNVVEIDSHQQDPTKNSMLLSLGYVPFHFFNWEITDSLVEFLKNLHGRYKFTNIKNSSRR